MLLCKMDILLICIPFACESCPAKLAQMSVQVLAPDRHLRLTANIHSPDSIRLVHAAWETSSRQVSSTSPAEHERIMSAIHYTRVHFSIFMISWNWTTSSWRSWTYFHLHFNGDFHFSADNINFYSLNLEYKLQGLLKINSFIFHHVPITIRWMRGTLR